jgi:hypothetical protein
VDAAGLARAEPPIEAAERRRADGGVGAQPEGGAVVVARADAVAARVAAAAAPQVERREPLLVGVTERDRAIERPAPAASPAPSATRPAVAW